jgi:hypothetical protein
MMFADETTSNITQWIGLGGATALLIWLLKFASDYQSTMTKGAFDRIESLEKSIERLDLAVENGRIALENERKRCDELASRLHQLEGFRYGDKERQERREEGGEGDA